MLQLNSFFKIQLGIEEESWNLGILVLEVAVLFYIADCILGKGCLLGRGWLLVGVFRV